MQTSSLVGHFPPAFLPDNCSHVYRLVQPVRSQVLSSGAEALTGSAHFY